MDNRQTKIRINRRVFLHSAAAATVGLTFSPMVLGRNTWGEPLNGMRMRVTAPAGTVYKRGMSLPLVLEIRNISDQPILLNKLFAFLSFKVTDRQNKRLGVQGYLYNHVTSWEGVDGTLGPGEIISDTCYLERLRFKMPSTEKSLTLSFQLPTQKVIPGKLPINEYSNPITVQLTDSPFEHLLKSEDLPEKWTESIDVVYREIGFWSGNMALHINGKGRVTTVGTRLGTDAPLPNGRRKYLLKRAELDTLMRELRKFKIERLNAYDRKMFATDLVHIHLYLAMGGHVFSGEYELFGSKTEPVSALQTIMRELLAKIVADKNPDLQ